MGPGFKSRRQFPNSQLDSTYPFGHDSKGHEVLIGPLVKYYPVPAKSAMIGSHAWIGNRVSIIGIVRIGDDAVSADNSHVVGDIGA